ncbi:MAG: UDP-N-acetylmuramate dehydrogenase [Minisyncoccia bacterium]
MKLKILKKVTLKKYTSTAVGGPAEFFVTVRSEGQLLEALNFAKSKKLKWYIIGGGTNIIPSDRGFTGLIIKNEISTFEIRGNRALIGSGNILLNTILRLNKNGLGGMEKMAGIPGTVGGAIYGCAGAFGQETKNGLIRVRFFDGKKFRWLNRNQCQFGYRESVFKKKMGWIITSAEFGFIKSGSKELTKISNEIMETRNKRFPPDLKCPGSFFKNVVLDELPKKVSVELRRLAGDKLKDWHDKIPAGWFLEQVGAKGMVCGKIRVSKEHGNLIYNSGNGRSADIEKISKILENRVKLKFGIRLEKEVQFL